MGESYSISKHPGYQRKRRGGGQETYTVGIAHRRQFPDKLEALLVAVDGAATHGADVVAGDVPRDGGFGKAARLLAADAGDGLFGLAGIDDWGGHFVRTWLAFLEG